MNYLTYPLPILAMTTQGIDVREKGARDRLASFFKIPQPHYCIPKHGSHIVAVDSLDDPFREGDALITRKSNLPLMICHADCQAAIFYDAVERVLALAHSGWRGSNQNILGKVVATMQSWGCTQIKVCISPSLGPENAEFQNYKRELDPALWKYQWKENYFDFWKISTDQLLEAGIKEENLFLQKICTYSDRNFFSYRRDKTAKRDATLAMMSRSL